MQPTIETDAVTPALRRWRGERTAMLDIARDACLDRADPPGRRAHLLGAYVSALAAQFQRFCADLLSDLADALLSGVPLGAPAQVEEAVRIALTAGHALDHGNPTRATLDRDFRRYGITLPAALRAVDHRAGDHLGALTTMLTARNSIVHGTAPVTELGPGGGPLTPARVEEWRRSLSLLADTLDEVVRRHVRFDFGIHAPWSPREDRS